MFLKLMVLKARKKEKTLGNPKVTKGIWGSLACITKGKGLNGWGSIPGKGKVLFNSTASRPAMRTTQLPSNGYKGDDFTEGKATGALNWPIIPI
jgi:hypothetical protein